MDLTAAVLLSVGAVSLISLIGVVAVRRTAASLRQILMPLVALAAGGMLGNAFLHLLPEAVAEQGEFTAGISLAVLAGIMSFLVLEKFIHWEHSHDLCEEDHVHPIGKMSLVGDAFHNFIDGLLIAGAYLAGGIEAGLAVTLAVALHEIPQEIGDFAILVHAGYTPGRALFFNLLSALAAFLGAGVVLAIGERGGDLLDWIVPFTAGGFLYIAASDLVPEIQKEKRPVHSIVLVGAFAAGIALMALLPEG